VSKKELEEKYYWLDVKEALKGFCLIMGVGFIVFIIYLVYLIINGGL
jgi:preprotein translocase subunit Sss1